MAVTSAEVDVSVAIIPEADELKQSTITPIKRFRTQKFATTMKTTKNTQAPISASVSGSISKPFPAVV